MLALPNLSQYKTRPISQDLIGPHRNGLLMARMARLIKTKIMSEYPISRYLKETYGTSNMAEVSKTQGKSMGEVYNDYQAWKKAKPQEDLITDFGKLLYAWWEEEKPSDYYRSLLVTYHDHLTRKVEEGHAQIKSGNTLFLNWDWVAVLKVRDHIESLVSILYDNNECNAGIMDFNRDLSERAVWIDLGLWELMRHHKLHPIDYTLHQKNIVFYSHIKSVLSHYWWLKDMNENHPPVDEEEVRMANECGDSPLLYSDFLL